ncbi:MAG: hypothetical protein IM534_03450 [Chitinophagaceae bacterium]|nr:hypothetical protein [Chitinophagaceae bacterium]MCA6486894.1 hypothetical protein [Chitinophagaceae bacterium]
MRGIALFCFLLILLLPAVAQQVNGHWYGVGKVQYPRQSNSYLSELVLRQQGTRVWGDFIYYFKDSILQVPIRGRYNNTTRSVQLQPFPVVYFQSMSASRGLYIRMEGYFRLVASKTESSLQGMLFSIPAYRYMVPDINFKLVKSNDTLPLVKEPDTIPQPVKKVTVYKNISPTKPIAKPVTPTPIVPGTTAKTVPLTITEFPVVAGAQISSYNLFKERSKDVSRVLEVDNDTLRLELFDNGQIDGDSVSVFLNNRLLLDKSMLDISGLKLTIRIDTSLAYDELAMFAHNLGNFPPNSALLVLYDGKKRYEIFLNSTLNSTATIRIRKRSAVRK